MKNTKYWQDMEKKEPLYIPGGNVIWCSHCENSLVAPQEIKHTVTVIRWPRHLVNVYMNVYSSIIYDCQKVKMTQICPPMDEWINKLPYTHTRADTCYNVNEPENIIIREISQTRKVTYCTVPCKGFIQKRQIHTERTQIGHFRELWEKGNGEWLFNGYRHFLG